MRAYSISMCLVVFALLVCAAAKDETVDELKSRVHGARPEDRPELCIRIARHQLANADKLYTDGKPDDARVAVDDVVTYSEQARDAATQVQKHLKNVEIDVRKIAEKLRDIKRTLAFEDQAPVDHAIRGLEDIRTALLKEMFKDNKKKNDTKGKK